MPVGSITGGFSMTASSTQPGSPKSPASWARLPTRLCRQRTSKQLIFSSIFIQFFNKKFSFSSFIIFSGIKCYSTLFSDFNSFTFFEFYFLIKILSIIFIFISIIIFFLILIIITGLFFNQFLIIPVLVWVSFFFHHL
jgi:hypothetical protein